MGRSVSKLTWLPLDPRKLSGVGPAPRLLAQGAILCFSNKCSPDCATASRLAARAALRTSLFVEPLCLLLQIASVVPETRPPFRAPIDRQSMRRELRSCRLYSPAHISVATKVLGTLSPVAPASRLLRNKATCRTSVEFADVRVSQWHNRMFKARKSRHPLCWITMR